LYLREIIKKTLFWTNVNKLFSKFHIPNRHRNWKRKYEYSNSNNKPQRIQNRLQFLVMWTKSQNIFKVHTLFCVRFSLYSSSSSLSFFGTFGFLSGGWFSGWNRSPWTTFFRCWSFGSFLRSFICCDLINKSTKKI
jgi:hypothetical protein